MQLQLRPNTDDPENEAIRLTHSYKACVSDIASPDTLNVRSFDDYLAYAIKRPQEPSRFSAKWDAKSYNHMHFWSGWIPGIKKFFGNAADWEKHQARKAKVEAETDAIFSDRWKAYQLEIQDYYEQVREYQESFEEKSPLLIGEYFSFVLASDRYSVKYLDEFQPEVIMAQYDSLNLALTIGYRIPAQLETFPLDYFVYDQQNGLLVGKELSKGIAVDYRMDIARKVLLRAAATVFLSDQYEAVQVITINGFLHDNDTDGRRITVLKATFKRNDVLSQSPGYVNLEDLFKMVYQEEHSPELYHVPAYQLRELLIKPKIGGKEVDAAGNVISVRQPNNTIKAKPREKK